MSDGAQSLDFKGRIEREKQMAALMPKDAASLAEMDAAIEAIASKRSRGSARCVARLVSTIATWLPESESSRRSETATRCR